MACMSIKEERKREMTLNEALSDPLIRQVMIADGIDPRVLAGKLNEVARALEARTA
jgi:hypothetical protein